MIVRRVRGEKIEIPRITEEVDSIRPDTVEIPPRREEPGAPGRSDLLPAP
jgi:hypothetical protein